MLPKDLVGKNNLHITKDALALCDQGIELMEKSIDGLHDHNHVLRIVQNLNDFLANTQELKKEDINFNVLLPAICWHDSWKSMRFPKNLFHLAYHMYMDGIGSSKLFKKATKNKQIPKKMKKEIAYAIKKHAMLQFRKPKTIEAKLLKDMDKLDEWALERLKEVEKKMLKDLHLNKKTIRLAIFYFKRKMLKTKESKFHFEWSKKEFQKRKQIYIDYVSEYIEKNQYIFEATNIKIPNFLQNED